MDGANILRHWGNDGTIRRYRERVGARAMRRVNTRHPDGEDNRQTFTGDIVLVRVADGSGVAVVS